MQRHKYGIAALLASVVTALFAVLSIYLGIRLAMVGIHQRGHIADMEIFLGGGVLPLLALFAAGLSWLTWHWGRESLHRPAPGELPLDTRILP